MKVILNIDPIKYPLTGIARYTYELAQALQSSSIDELLFMRGNSLMLKLPEPQAQSEFSYGLKSRLAQSSLLRKLYHQTKRFQQSRVLKNYENNIYHGPNFYLPQFNGPSVVTIHDLSPFLWSHCHPPERIKYMQKQIEFSVKKASAIITDSEYVRAEIIEHFDLNPSKVHTTLLGCGQEFCPYPEKSLNPILKKRGLNYKGYSLFTGTIEPRKNLLRLLDAYKQLPISLKTQYPLVVTGFKGWQSEKIHRALSKAQEQGWAHYLGYLPAEELPFVMSGAQLFIFPSLYEGFGLPVLEAMSSGTPVVCSNAASLPEVGGMAPLYHHPEDTEQLRTNIEKGLEDNNWRERAVELGFQQADKLTWHKCANDTIEVYKSLQSN